MARITGLGGVFLKIADREATSAWYKEILGLGGDWGAMFPFKSDDPEGFAMLSAFAPESDYFEPSKREFMINLRVDDLDGFIADLESKGIEILGRQDEDYGRFAWIVDLNDVKIELWQQLGPAPN